jgi:hypothetical protein
VGARDVEVEHFESLFRLLGRRGSRFEWGPRREPARWFARGSDTGRATAGAPGTDGDIDDAGDGHQPGEPAKVTAGFNHPPA